MRHLLLIPLILTLSWPVGCDTTSTGGDASGVASLRQALPTREAMTIQLPQSSVAALVLEHATYYRFTRQVALSVNGLVRDITGVIEDIIEQPPSATDGETYAVWGPWTEALSPATYRVTVARAADGGFDYTVEGWPKDQGEDASIVIFAGHHLDAQAPGDGDGGWAYDMSAANALDPIAQDATGTMEVAYALADTRALEVIFTDVQGPSDPQATSALYRFAEAADGSGTLDYTTTIDIHENDEDAQNLDRRELVQVRSRWLPDGPGRADLVASHGDLHPGIAVDVTECWDAAFASSYLFLSYPGGESVEGDAASCAYADRQLPQFDGFDPEAFADGGLVVMLPDRGDVELDPIPVEEEAAETAIYYQLGTETIAALGDQVGGVLELVHEISRAPASECDDDGCRWGPWTDWTNALTWTLIAMGDEATGFGYQLLVQSVGDGPDAWQTLVEGGIDNSGGDDGELGWFVYDLDVASRFDPSVDNSGTYRAEYAGDGQDAALHVRLDQVVFDEGVGPADGRYYVATTGGAGFIDMAIPSDIDGNDDGSRASAEDVTIRIRWADGGTGVADVLASGGDLGPTGEALAVQCWDDSAQQTHFSYVLRQDSEMTLPNLDGPGCVFTDWQTVDFPAMGDAQN